MLGIRELGAAILGTGVAMKVIDTMTSMYKKKKTKASGKDLIRGWPLRSDSELIRDVMMTQHVKDIVRKNMKAIGDIVHKVRACVKI